MFENFDEKTGKLTYMEQDQPYIAAALIALNEDDDMFVTPELSRPINYSEATTAIANLISVSPSTPPPATEAAGAAD